VDHRLFEPAMTLIWRIWNVHSPLAFPNTSAKLIWLIASGLAIALWPGRKACPDSNGRAWAGSGLEHWSGLEQPFCWLFQRHFK